jgi:VIT1/CCC1 family predicted Fe2+/Mn2+ transporter
MSMAVGEYVSVSTQRDSEQSLLDKERRELHETPDEELDELTGLYVDRGLSHALARQVAQALTEHDALAAHAEVELGIDPEALTNPWHAAWASFIAFTAGAMLPLFAIILPGAGVRVGVTFVAVLLALVGTGWVSSRMGESPPRPAIVRNVLGGALAMAVTFGIGNLIGLAV